MRRLPLIALLLVVFSISAVAQQNLAQVEPVECQPAETDYSLMWWPNGLRKKTSIDYPLTGETETKDRFIRCIRTGHFGLIFDVETAQLLRLSAMEDAVPYHKAVSETNMSFIDNVSNQDISLKFNVQIKGQRYWCQQSAVPEKGWEASSIVESGRFFQRFLIEGLRFADEDGEILDASGKLEVAAWPDCADLKLSVTHIDTKGTKITPREWKIGNLEIKLEKKNLAGNSSSFSSSSMKGNWGIGETHEIITPLLAPISINRFVVPMPVGQTLLTAKDIVSGKEIPVKGDIALKAFYISLDDLEPQKPDPAKMWRQSERLENDILERIEITVKNPSERNPGEDPAGMPFRFVFEKSKPGYSITGMSAIIRDSEGNPTGIPVQLSKNWHKKEGLTQEFEGPWFRGYTMLRVPDKSETKFELTLAYAHWGGVPAASHSQLSLIGWGNNQLWEEAAIGSWGESLCFEPDQGQKGGAVLDTRPLMVWQKDSEEPKKWGWTNNVGGADFLVYYKKPAEGEKVKDTDTNDEPRHDGIKQWNTRMKTMNTSSGPNMTQVTYAGVSQDNRIALRYTVSLYRTDDITRGLYRFRYDIVEPVDFSRLVFFQCGGDDYSYTNEKKFAYGNENGLVREWGTFIAPGKPQYRSEPFELLGRIPWVSMHESISRDTKSPNTWANRGLIVRQWDARINGKKASPWIAERSAKVRGTDVSLVDFVPPPGVTSLMKGDYIEGEIVHAVFPKKASDYYGPNESLRKALEKDGDTWKIVLREAIGNDIEAKATTGTVLRDYPLVIKIADKAENGELARFTLRGGLGFVPVSFSGLPKHAGYSLFENIDGKLQPVNQSVHGYDFWQCDYDAANSTYRRTYTLPLDTPDDTKTTREFVLK